MRGTFPDETRINNPIENERDHFPLREAEEEGSSGSSCRRENQLGEKMKFGQAFSATTSEYNGDDRNKINIQLSLSEGFNNTSTNPVSTLLPKTSVEYWNSDQAMGQEGSGVVSHPGSLGPNMNYHGPSSGGSSEYWIQDEKELKRQKRKEANRESAKRSRLRKQSECDELTEKVQNLTAENETLRLEVHRLSDMCQKLSAENVFLYDRLAK